MMRAKSESRILVYFWSLVWKFFHYLKLHLDSKLYESSPSHLFPKWVSLFSLLLLVSILPETQVENVKSNQLTVTSFHLSACYTYKSYLPNYISDKGTLSEIYNESLKFNKEKKNTIINESKSWHFAKSRYRCGK